MVTPPAQRITVLAAGAWGTALAVNFASHHHVTLWDRQAASCAELRRTRLNPRLPGIALPDGLQVEAELASALAGADLAVVATATAGLRPTLREVSRLAPGLPVLWACKGFEADTGLLLHQLADQELPASTPRGALSGPSFAHEVARHQPTALTLASADLAFASHTAQWLNSSRLRVYFSDDVVGVEVGGAVKNVMAIAAGIADGLQLGLNARAALITRGLAEITRLGMALGGRAETFMGLTGMGDLILTCTGDSSRNRRVGLGLAAGQSLDQVLAALGHVAEGVPTTREAHRKALALGVEMPLTEAVYQILFEQRSAQEALEALLLRAPRHEASWS